MNKQGIIHDILENRMVAIARRVPLDRLLRSAEALYAGGIRFLEVTFEPGSFHDDAAAAHMAETTEAIVRLTEQMKGRMHIGAGTVMTEEQVELARQAGAEFILAPDLYEPVIRAGNRAGMVTIPGAMTPTEIANAFRWGADIVKVFPAGVLGPRYFKDVLGPLGKVPLIAVGGGVLPETIPDFLRAGASGFGVGSALFRREWMDDGAWDEMTANAGRFVAAAHSVNG